MFCFLFLFDSFEELMFLRCELVLMGSSFMSFSFGGGGGGGRWSLHGLNWPQQKKMVMVVSFLYVCLFYYVRMD